MNLSKHIEVAPIEVTAIEGQQTYGGKLLARPMIQGTTMTFLEITYEAGVGAPLHVHDHESMIYVVSGKVKTIVGNDEYVLGPGDVCCHPARVPHTVQAIEASVMVEVKSPAPNISAFFSIA